MYVVPTAHCPVLCNCCSVTSQLTVYNTTARFPNVTVSTLVLSHTVHLPEPSLCHVLCVALQWHARVRTGLFFPAVMLKTQDAEASVAVMLQTLLSLQAVGAHGPFQALSEKWGAVGPTLSLTGMWWSRLRRESTPVTCTRKNNAKGR